MSRPDTDEIRNRLYALAAENNADLGEGALLIAAEDDPTLDIEPYIHFLDELARKVGAAVGGDDSAERWREAMANELFTRQRFQGDDEEYYDPRNSYLNQVIDRRRGIPVTLSIVYLAVGARLGLPVAGVNAPGHFLVRHGERVIDPFHGGNPVASDALRDQLEQMQATDPAAELRRLLSSPPSARMILCRVLGNLKANHLRKGDLTRALVAVDRLVGLNPNNPAELRDRGVIYQRLECPRAAAADFERYLELVPGDPEADIIRNAIVQLTASAGRLH
jgi:regulator of sirC expression with transglutaminase-like and TPR domain